ncbi:type I restriction enzyme, S subunit [Bifidobacterium bifidum]|uniref:restriction endonuclease subunit S n=2 Tax=Bifidobacterium bifidum TaxID=1681 RepID=UPI0008F23950|nr:restriction endonuclease subunit S [Bifidobacterium bifidum]SFC34931.1 type I restriction enzyme, S subunit [Bifidobacterium bifidum]
MTEQAKVPAIRFAGFTDPWEQRKFSDIVDVCSGKDYKHLEEGPIPVYGTGGFMTSVDEALSYDRDAVGIGRKGTIDKPYLLKAPFWTVDTLFYAIPKSDMDLEFVHCSFLNVDWKSKDESTGLPSLSKEAINETIALVPSFNEQSRLGEFFSDLDSLITLHQRKYDKLVVFKKSMLEKMFPKDGESVPEIRFAGFTDPWEQRKLGELEKDATLYMGRGRVISAKDMSNTPGTFPVYSSSALDNGRMGAYGKYMFNQELITWSIDGGGAVFYRRKHRFSVTNVSGYIAVNPEKINCKFLAYAMSLAHSRIKFDYTVKAHPSVIRSLYTMGIPISLQEQQVIGSFFSRLDNLITLHQRKLELLRNIKKSLLDKMFV